MNYCKTWNSVARLLVITLLYFPFFNFILFFLFCCWPSTVLASQFEEIVPQNVPMPKALDPDPTFSRGSPFMSAFVGIEPMVPVNNHGFTAKCYCSKKLITITHQRQAMLMNPSRALAVMLIPALLLFWQCDLNVYQAHRTHRKYPTIGMVGFINNIVVVFLQIKKKHWLLKIGLVPFVRISTVESTAVSSIAVQWLKTQRQRQTGIW